jgi:formate dehydrogenase major subunit
MIRFTLDGREVEAAPGESLWDVARREGTEIPYLCHRPQPGYRPDGNCRACLVEIEGERVLAASCIRQPRDGMAVHTATERAERARRMVFELLLADQPSATGRDASAGFGQWTQRLGLTGSRFAPEPQRPAADLSHPAMAVQLDACIQCGLCERACREVQHNDVIGLARRGMEVTVSFDLLDPMGASSCVACGECVQACPTGALLPKSVLDDAGHRAAPPAKEVASVCPYCGVGCQVGFRVRDGAIEEVVGRDGPSNQGRLCVKGRFGFDYLRHPDRLTRPLVRVAPKDAADCLDPRRARAKFREASWE